MLNLVRYTADENSRRFRPTADTSNDPCVRLRLSIRYCEFLTEIFIENGKIMLVKRTTVFYC